MYRHLRNRLIEAVIPFVFRTYNLSIAGFAVEQPPKIEFGEYAFPLAFELARKLRKPPRKVAEEIVAGIGTIEGFEKLEVAGAGYINARLNRSEFASAIITGESPKLERLQRLLSSQRGKILVEHSSINPNKAAHIGHLRNAILGDTFVRLLRSAGREV
ncbi:MAG: arginine--tRNA ligase, partial [Candidatus Sulfotelmatobacter sp.]